MSEFADYLGTLSPSAAVTVGSFRTRALELVPTAEDGVSYGMPALRYRGRPLVAIVESRGRYTVYPFSADVVAAVLGDLDGFDATKGGIRFTDAAPLPTAAFDRLVQARQAEIDAALGRSGGGRGR
jgi:uncharacterized protein YdhG (YjbR/CyaY superfamily)